MDSKKCFIGIGELTADEVYINEDDNIKHIKSISGGNVWNVFSYVAREFNAIAIANCADDEGGRRSIESLNAFGVDTKYIQKSLKNTHKLHIIINQHNADEYEDVFSSMICPITKQIEEYTCDCRWIKEYNVESFAGYDEAIVMTDKFDNDYLEFIFNLKKKYNYNIAIDIGHRIMIEHLNNLEVTQILSNIDFLQINQKIFNYFNSRKLYLDDIMKSSTIKLITLTKGSKGVEFVYRNNEEILTDKFDIEKPAKIKDPTGAGDTFFATTLKILLKNGLKNTIDSNVLKKVFVEAVENTSEIVGIIGARKEH